MMNPPSTSAVSVVATHPSQQQPTDSLDHSSKSEFIPPAWLRSAHVQSILPTLAPQTFFTRRRAARLLARAEACIINCGNDVRLLGYYSRHFRRTLQSRHLVVLLHGWEGSADSNYVLSLGAKLYDLGCDVMRLNFRDHGPSHHLNRELFHSCRLAEVVGAIKQIQQQSQGAELSLAGFSLGGNFSLRVAARAPQSGIKLRRVVAICPVVSPHRTLVALESGWGVYRKYFLRKWKRSLAIKQRKFPDYYDFTDLRSLDDLTAMTDLLVRKHSEYTDLDAYLTGYSLLNGALADLEVPVHVIASLDDPIITPEDWADLGSVPHVTLELTRYGGHCGFMRGMAEESWADEAATRALLG